tara:strand:+ start:162 stop:362 length:201 start_codon:yes stop_codon:yes gene_type:complete
MAEDPIEKIKSDISKLTSLCDELRIAINSSNQREVTQTVKKLEFGLDGIKASMRREFSWLFPPTQE